MKFAVIRKADAGKEHADKLKVRSLHELEKLASGEGIEHHARIRETVANR